MIKLVKVTPLSMIEIIKVTDNHPINLTKNKANNHCDYNWIRFFSRLPRSSLFAVSKIGIL